MENGVRTLRAEQWVPHPLETVFEFFCNPANLAELTPEETRMEILPPAPTSMETGTEITYKLRVAGIPMRWKARIESCDPPRSFTDVQLKGPYRSWMHTHRFEPKDGGTLLIDEIEYTTPCCRVGHKWLVRPQLEKIFQFRGERVAQRFGSR